MSSNAASADSSLRVIVGPTAAGKSALALALAEQFAGAIISADSRQVYRGFDIGTGKPSAAERARVPHWGVDVADADERWSAARFAEEAGAWIAAAERARRVPVVVGGTGLWVRALITPFAPVPDLDPDRRAALGRHLAACAPHELRAWCAALDPGIAPLGPAQWRRAIEVALLTGRRLSDWRRDASHTVLPRPARYLVLDPGPALDALIAARVDAMFAAGWVAEVRALAAAVPNDAIAWKACGYERVRAALEAARNAAIATGSAETAASAMAAVAAEVRGAIVTETRQYARRQRTWFRRQLTAGPVTRLDPLAHDAVARARAWWNGEDDE